MNNLASITRLFGFDISMSKQVISFDWVREVIVATAGSVNVDSVEVLSVLFI